MVRAIQAAVHAVVREVERRKENDAIAVVGLFDVMSKLFYFCINRRIVACQQYGGFAMSDNGAMIVRGVQIGTCFIENGTTELNIMCMLIGIGERF